MSEDAVRKVALEAFIRFVEALGMQGCDAMALGFEQGSHCVHGFLRCPVRRGDDDEELVLGQGIGNVLPLALQREEAGRHKSDVIQPDVLIS